MLQKYLKLETDRNNMLDGFKSLFSRQEMVDVTLACNGEHLKAHKTVLSACSPFFKSLLLENPCKHPIVIFHDMGFRELKVIIKFMYYSKVNIVPEQLSALKKMAETLNVTGLQHSLKKAEERLRVLRLREVKKARSQSGNKSPHRSAHSGADAPSPKQRKGRRRKRSVSDQSDDQPPKSKRKDSGIEELSSDIERSASYSSAASAVPLQPSHPSSFRSQQQQLLEQNIDTFEREKKCNIESTKQLQQSLTTDDFKKRSGHSSVHSIMKLQRRRQSFTDHSTSLVPVAPSPMSSDAIVSSQQPESPPEYLYECDEVVWVKVKKGFWPALVLGVNEVSVNVKLINGPTKVKSLKVKHKAIRTFDSRKLNLHYLAQAECFDHKGAFVNAVKSSERFMSKKFLGMPVTGKEFFSVRDEVDFADSASSESIVESSEPTKKALYEYLDAPKLLKYLLEGNADDYVMDIYSRKTYSKKHDDFFENHGNKSKEYNNIHKPWFGSFENKNAMSHIDQEALYEHFWNLFVNKVGKKSYIVSYVLQVMIPEAIVKAISDMKNILLEDARLLFESEDSLDKENGDPSLDEIVNSFETSNRVGILVEQFI